MGDESADVLYRESAVFRQDAAVVAGAITDHWKLPQPVRVSESLPRGVTADIWLVTDGRGDRYVAKFVYDTQAVAEAGLRAAEFVEQHSRLRTGAPVRTHGGELTVMLPSTPGEQHPLALLRFVAGTAGSLAPEEAAGLLVQVQDALRGVRVPAVHAVFEYLTDDSIEIAYADRIRPVLHDAVKQVLDTPDLTWVRATGTGPKRFAPRAGSRSSTGAAFFMRPSFGT